MHAGVAGDEQTLDRGAALTRRPPDVQRLSSDGALACTKVATPQEHGAYKLAHAAEECWQGLAGWQVHIAWSWLAMLLAALSSAAAASCRSCSVVAPCRAAEAVAMSRLLAVSGLHKGCTCGHTSLKY
jgi:hypothetical protein